MWVTGDLPAVYKHKDLLDFVLKLYNNRKAVSKWEGSAKDQKRPANEDTKFLVMMTHLEQIKRVMEMVRVNPMPRTKTKDTEKGLGPMFRPW
eukprot:13542996-Ditylum_brightwellii.AAC.1